MRLFRTLRLQDSAPHCCWDSHGTCAFRIIPRKNLLQVRVGFRLSPLVLNNKLPFSYEDVAHHVLVVVGKKRRGTGSLPARGGSREHFFARFLPSRGHRGYQAEKCVVDAGSMPGIRRSWIKNQCAGGGALDEMLYFSAFCRACGEEAGRNVWRPAACV